MRPGDAHNVWKSGRRGLDDIDPPSSRGEEILPIISRRKGDVQAAHVAAPPSAAEIRRPSPTCVDERRLAAIISHLSASVTGETIVSRALPIGGALGNDLVAPANSKAPVPGQRGTSSEQCAASTHSAGALATRAFRVAASDFRWPDSLLPHGLPAIVSPTMPPQGGEQGAHYISTTCFG